MAGYKGYSMSNRAIEAYEDGEKPLSKWTKAEILSQLEEEGLSKRKIESLSKMTVADMKDKLLVRTSWHHTSKHYNRTDFYSVDTTAAEKLDMRTYERPKPQPKEAIVKPEEERAIAEYLVWSGTRNYPKADYVKAQGMIKGNWFYPDNEKGKKSIYARGFRIIEKLPVKQKKNQKINSAKKESKPYLKKNKKTSAKKRR
ncbi:MAG: hypothetical protein FWD92_03625 [Methanomassiliicoccaceae archaeon]|nr:hypothetical protein [Methanomassiliicoccaceae archaeon]